MKPYLLDTNVLIALAWPNHVHHRDVLAWFERKGSAAFRTCPITETGFVRISSNPNFTRDAVTPGDGVALLDRVARLPGYAFWPDDISLCAAAQVMLGLTGHRQVTDAYLLALAHKHGGVLATLDRAVPALARKGMDGAVEIVC